MNKDIAIIGMWGRFPLANDPGELFENLKEGVDCVTAISPERVKQTALPQDRTYRLCGYLTDIDKFDYNFFGISPAEAKSMCPEQRMLLECVHAAMENAGYSPNYFSGSNTAVMVTTAYSGYDKHASENITMLVTGNSPEYLAAKIGRQFNLKGNVSVIDTTCSSALVAVHMACNEIITGDAGMAIVAGVNLLLFPFADEPGGLETESPDGKSRAFSAAANGMSYGEMAVAIILKPLEQAMQDGDNIQAVIKSTAVNCNGNNSSSITAPDSRSQADVLVKAWNKAGISATDLSYIEAHGSGTQLGDSLEFEALNMAFARYTSAKHICPISTIKSNIGHGRTVSGLAGLVKTVLSLKNKVLFPTIHFEQPGPLLDINNAAVYINTEYLPWNPGEHKTRYAGLTTLGASGTNCHVVLQEALPYQHNKETSGTKYFHIPVSGKTEKALKQNAEALLACITKNENIAVEDISYTLATGRAHYEYRWSYMVASASQLAGLLKNDLLNEAPVKPVTAEVLVFLFSDSTGLTGDTIQQFKQQYPVFNKNWNECEAIMPLATDSLKDFAFQYCFYQLLNNVDINTTYYLPLGIGKTVHRVIDNQLTLAEALAEAKRYEPQEMQNIEERVNKLMNKLAGNGNITIADLSVNGTLKKHLCKYNSLEEDTCYITCQEGSFENDLLLHIIHTLYVRKNKKSTAYIARYNLTGRKIELPPYQFEKTRCWIRDMPKETLAGVEKENHEKQVLTGNAGIIETRLAGIIAPILQIQQLSVNDDFFELGGDSLKATKVIQAVNKTFNISLNFEDLFDLPQVSSLAQLVKKQLGTEQRIALAWEIVLECTNLKPADDFFELGGHSLMATQVIVLLNKEFSVTLNFEDIFQHPTIQQLARFIETKTGDKKDTGNQQQVKPAVHSTSYALTYAQKRMWFLSHFVGHSSAYNNVLGVYLEGELDYETFDKTILYMLQKHEGLRTTFTMEGDEPVQHILDAGKINFRAQIINIEKEENVPAVIDRLFEAEREVIFNLSAFPLFAIKLIKTGYNRHCCFLNIHHIISDGWSMGVFLEDFYGFYENILQRRTIEVKPPAIQLKDYAEWQKGEEFKKIMAQQEQYWLKLFTEAPPVLALPYDYNRPKVQSFAGDSIAFTIDQLQTNELKKIARENGATLYMVLLAIYNILLGKLGNAEDITVGSPVAGRRFDGLQSLIGLFVNTIVMRSRPLPHLRFSDFLSDVKQMALEAFNNQDYPYEELVKKLLPERDTSRNPLFDTMFILQNNKEAGTTFGPLTTLPYHNESKTARFDLLVEAYETKQGMEIRFEYATDLFAKATIERFVTYFKKIIASVTANVQIKIGDIDILPGEEKHLLLKEYNDTMAAYPHNKTIIDIFEKQVEKTPDAIALRWNDSAMTYCKLHETAGKIAAYLQKVYGVATGHLAGVLLEREEYLIPCILGILKAGAAYVPIDPKYPAERIHSIIGDAKLKVLITREKYLAGNIPATQVLNLDECLPSINEQNASSSGSAAGSKDLAYVIYTSGSTGKPKGVMIEHHSVLNRVLWMQKKYPLTEQDVILQKTPIVFDVSVWELFWWSFTGASMCLLEPGAEKDPGEIIKAINKHGVTTMHFVPSMLGAFLPALQDKVNRDAVRSLGLVFTSGEALKPQQVNMFGKLLHAACGTRLINLYGPTEATVDVSYCECTFEKECTSVPIGKPIDNTRLYILDKSNRLTPPGVPGELCIAGAGLSRGYLGNEKLTREKFVQNPYDDSDIIYKTGDLAKWLPGGNIDFLGRIDDQVKIRGFRIEPGEIESQLATHALVQEAVVTVKQHNGENYLVAYYMSKTEIPFPEIRNFLQQKLPDYMIPALYMRIDSIPLTANGKANRRALPEPEMKSGKKFNAPATDNEKKLAAIWSRILNFEESKIGIYDDFFALGGHSIMAIRLTYAIEKEFSVNIDLRKIFEHATIEKQVLLIGETGTVSYTSIPSVEKREYYLASPAQEALYYEYMLDKENLSYNISAAYKINGPLDTHNLHYTLQQLVNIHQGLRTGFAFTGDTVIQKIEQQVLVDFVNMDAGKYHSLQDAFNVFVRPFNLAGSSLARFGLLQLEGHGNFLFVDIHHIICDGIALNILMKDFKVIYKNAGMPVVGVQYIDYVHWQKRKPAAGEKKLAYWLKQLAGELPEIDLPVKQTRVPSGSFRVAAKTKEISGTMYRNIKKQAVDANVSDFMFMLSGCYILLAKMSGNADVIIGTDALGRTHATLENIVGTFINVLPLRCRVANEKTYSEFLAGVRKCVLEAFDNQGYQLHQAISMLNSKDKKTTQRVIDVHFSFTNFLEIHADAGEQEFVAVEMDDAGMASEYEFKIEIAEENSCFTIAFIYSKELYDEETIELLMQYYMAILENVIHNKNICIGDIEMENQTANITL